MTVVVTAVFFPVAGKQQELAQAMQRGIAAVDGTVTMIEKWSSAEDLDAHGSGSVVEILRGDVADLVAKPAVVTRMTPIPAGTPEQGLL